MHTHSCASINSTGGAVLLAVISAAPALEAVSMVAIAMVAVAMADTCVYSKDTQVHNYINCSRTYFKY